MERAALSSAWRDRSHAVFETSIPMIMRSNLISFPDISLSIVKDFGVTFVFHVLGLHVVYTCLYLPKDHYRAERFL